MKLPADCPYAGNPPRRIPWETIDTVLCCRAHSRFRDDEEPLCRTLRTEAEVYRFIWRSSFDGDAVVRIGRQDDEITVRWVYRWFRTPSPDDAPPVVALTLADWARLQDALAASFWALDPDGVEWPIDGDEQQTIAAVIASRGLDGSDWLIEGRRKDVFRAMIRWSPRGTLHDLAKLFFELAGPPLATIKDLLSNPSAGLTIRRRPAADTQRNELARVTRSPMFASIRPSRIGMRMGRMSDSFINILKRRTNLYVDGGLPLRHIPIRCQH
jgi:hypothetical protein